MNELIEEWIEKAEKDFATAVRESKIKDYPNYDAVCYHAQQCIEKLMKALILKHNEEIEYTHNLVSLQNSLLAINPIYSFNLYDLNFLSRAAVDFRYPGENADEDEAVEAVSICRSLRSQLQSYIGNEFFRFEPNNDFS